MNFDTDYIKNSLIHSYSHVWFKIKLQNINEEKIFCPVCQKILTIKFFQNSSHMAHHSVDVKRFIEEWRRTLIEKNARVYFFAVYIHERMNGNVRMRRKRVDNWQTVPDGFECPQIIVNFLQEAIQMKESLDLKERRGVPLSLQDNEGIKDVLMERLRQLNMQQGTTPVNNVAMEMVNEEEMNEAFEQEQESQQEHQEQEHQEQEHHQQGSQQEQEREQRERRESSVAVHNRVNEIQEQINRLQEQQFHLIQSEMTQQMEEETEIDRRTLTNNGIKLDEIKEVVSHLNRGKDELNEALKCTREFDDEREEMKFLHMVIASVCGGHFFTRSDTDAVCSLINYLFQRCGVNITFKLRYTTMVKNIMLLFEWNKDRLKLLLVDCWCFCVCMDGESEKKRKDVGVSMRVVTQGGETIEERVVIDKLDEESSTGYNNYLFIMNLIKKNGDIMYKCCGFTSDGAGNMRGCEEGLATYLENDILESTNKQNTVRVNKVPIDCIFYVPYHCQPHRHNLTIEELCSTESITVLIKVIDLLNGSMLQRWVLFEKRKKLKRIPSRSVIRWTYVYDAVHYLFVNYDNVIEFINENELCERLISSSNSQQMENIDDVFRSQFYSRLVAADCILKEVKTLNTKLQQKLLTVREGYELIMKHIELMYKCNDELSDYKEKKLNEIDTENRKNQVARFLIDHRSSILYNYFKYDEEKIANTIDDVIEMVKTYLEDLLKRFLYIDESSDEDISLTSFPTYKDYEEHVDIVNSKNDLYNTIKLITSYEKKEFNVPENLPKEVKMDYAKLLEQLNSSNVFIGNIELALEHFNMKDTLLYYYVLASKCVMSSSCSVEGSFSVLGRAWQSGMNYSTLNAKMLASTFK